MGIIYHLTSREGWAAGQAAGEYAAPSLADEGFIHCSGDEDQTLRVAQRLYAGLADLLVLDVETGKLNAEVKREISARSGEMYPHVYGTINLDAVVRVRELALDSEGKHTISREPAND